MTGTKKSFEETLEKTHDNDGRDEDNISIGSREREDEENQRRAERLQRLLYSLEETPTPDQAQLEDQDIEQLAE